MTLQDQIKKQKDIIQAALTEIDRLADLEAAAIDADLTEKMNALEYTEYDTYLDEKHGEITANENLQGFKMQVTDAIKCNEAGY